MTEMKISVCTFVSGTFDVIIVDPETGHEVWFTGQKEMSTEDLDTVNKLAPACVWTTYSTEQPNGNV